jgi:hypothetical protein
LPYIGIELNKTHTIELRESLLEFCRSKNWISPQAVTLTLRTSRPAGTVWVKLTAADAQQNLRHFLNVVHKKLAAYGFPKRAELQCVPIFEGDDAVRPHFHLMLDRPACIEAAEYADLLERAWSRTYWGHQRTEIKPCDDEDGWLDYISKLRTKSDYAAAIDWTNFS